MNTKTNESLQMALRQTCPHCGETTLRFITDDACHCINRDCAAFMVTLEVSQFITLTPAQLASYRQGQTNVRELDDAQTEFEKRVAEITAAAAKRAECRARGEKCYG